ncbi:hypothetical protein OG814_05510 [Streptomyces zaomyceticus]|uniref:EcsC family protein n=1 Tax=Streptomyces zaomyceticus TaxID=68286 RepID=A0ABZ1L8J5_9ACTN
MSKAYDPKGLIQQGLDRALVAQQPLASRNVERLRRVHPGDTPQELIRRLDRYYLAGVTASGGASGAAGIVPGAGIPTALADIMLFTEASVLYTLSLAEIHGMHPEDFERRRLLVLTVLLGDGAVSALDKVVGRTGAHWAKRIVGAIPMSAINKANKILGPRFITKYGTKQGVLVLSKQVPLGIGAALGAGGNHVFGRLTIKSARKIFGEPPSSWADGDRMDEVPFGPGSGESASPDESMPHLEPFIPEDSTAASEKA